MDWKFGRKDINFLVLSIVVGIVSMPLLCKVLLKKTKWGNSNIAQRKALTNRLLKLLLAKHIHMLTMEREFIGNEWLKWLDLKSVAFITRIKSNSLISGQHAFALAISKKYKIKGRQSAFGIQLFFAGKLMSRRSSL